MKLLENWLPPDGAGDPVACLATTFTFDADFFTNECLARFLRLSGAYGEGDSVSDVALMLEEEERLSEASVVVLADRNCRPEARNLRWDLLPASVPGGLLHAKVALLIWERVMRIIVGSANLTTAGYRRQLETAVAFDIDVDARVPRTFPVSLVEELRDIVRSHVYGDPLSQGPKARALQILDTAADRVAHLPNQPRGAVRLALAAGRTGVSPLTARREIWRGPRPHRVVALSPFWDDSNGSMPGAEAVLADLGKRGQEGTSRATFLVAVEALPGRTVIRAPLSLSQLSQTSGGIRVCAVKKELERLLHSKAILYEGSECLAVMIGSSNVTEKGLGLDRRSHREINVWFAAEPGSREAQQLMALLPEGDVVEPDWPWEAGADEDELSVPPLPDGFVDALLTSENGRRVVRLTFDVSRLPTQWSVTTPAGLLVMDSEAMRDQKHPSVYPWPVTEPFPSALNVWWVSTAGGVNASWPVNVGDLSLLPPAEELRELPVNVLLDVLASTRPLRAALERELRRRQISKGGDDELDPLRRFDASGQLLRRVRRASAALWGLQQRLTRPVSSIDAVEWRLDGPIGPRAIAEGLVADVKRGELQATECAFLLAELALAVSRVPWKDVSAKVDRTQVRKLVKGALKDIADLTRSVISLADGDIDGLKAYVEDALRKARVAWTGS